VAETGDIRGAAGGGGGCGEVVWSENGWAVIVEIPDEYVVDLAGSPLSMQTIHMVIACLVTGHTFAFKNCSTYQSVSDVMHKMELSIIAAHEARVRAARERGAQ
jgi:hypothetical protein